MYQQHYWRSPSAKDFGYTDYIGDADLYLRTFRMRASHLAREVPPPATVLEVGCAAGFSLAAFARLGYAVRGVELSESMVDAARQRVGTELVALGGIEAAEFGIERYDLIVMWDVVEHVDDPLALLKTARGFMTRDSRLALTTQNVEAVVARLLGRRWHHFKHEEHLYHFAPRTIRRLLGQVGLDVQSVSSRRAGKFVSLDFIIERSSRLHPRFQPLVSILRRLGNPSLYVNLGDEMFVIARRH